ncbi:Hypothetical protein UVM_LOCUS162 [uncultured virus]|nr:Hypothetical protein UVM_LOCUS162 [uncultured virus]
MHAWICRRLVLRCAKSEWATVEPEALAQLCRWVRQSAQVTAFETLPRLVRDRLQDIGVTAWQTRSVAQLFADARKHGKLASELPRIFYAAGACKTGGGGLQGAPPSRGDVYKAQEYIKKRSQVLQLSPQKIRLHDSASLAPRALRSSAPVLVTRDDADGNETSDGDDVDNSDGDDTESDDRHASESENGSDNETSDSEDSSDQRGDDDDDDKAVPCSSSPSGPGSLPDSTIPTSPSPSGAVSVPTTSSCSQEGDDNDDVALMARRHVKSLLNMANAVANIEKYCSSDYHKVGLQQVCEWPVVYVCFSWEASSRETFRPPDVCI